MKHVRQSKVFPGFILRGALAFVSPLFSARDPRDVVIHVERLRRRRPNLLLLLGISAAVLLFILEIETSWLQSRLLAAAGRRATYSVQPGPAILPRTSGRGPYDERLGYTRLGELSVRLKRAGYEVDSQARWSPGLRRLSSLGFFPPYPEKPQAGLALTDRNGDPLFESHLPEALYSDFSTIPVPVVNSLLFIENRELLHPVTPWRNPALEWDRTGKAVLDLSLRRISGHHSQSGGSTLATQLEKLRHSPGGRTRSVADKAQQIASASLRAYQEGPAPAVSRRRIVTDYLNSLPLAAAPGSGEVIGLADGLRAWFGADALEANRLLTLTDAGAAAVRQERARGLAFRRVLALLLSVNRPNYYLRRDRLALEERVDSYLRLLAGEGVISRKLRDQALDVRLSFRPAAPAFPGSLESGRKGPDRKGIDAVRIDLLPMLGVPSLYDLDRLDLTVRTTLDGEASKQSAALLSALADPAAAGRAGLFGEHLLAPGQGQGLVYSFALYERGEGANRLLVQVDTAGGVWNMNENTRLELGSTAKLRTLATYLEIVSELHRQLVAQRAGSAWQAGLEKADPITRWAADYAAQAKDRSLAAMLDAAMLRTYSANPGEAFFTGGGAHVFSNFEGKDNGRILTVREAFQRSVNLVFIRLMRDVVAYYMQRTPGYSAALLQDENHPDRRKYLERFADREGSVFLRTYYDKYAGSPAEEAFDRLLEGRGLSANRLAVITLAARPATSAEKLRGILSDRLGRAVDEKEAGSLYEKYRPGKFDWNDTGYLAGVHPLELWLAGYLDGHPRATLREVTEASRDLRQEVYRWLFKSRFKHAQDLRIRTVLEADAFAALHRSWKRQGYPFRSLVPSLGTAIGSSGDTPAALADLAGIVLNDGLRKPAVRVEKLHFAAGTPFETAWRYREPQPVRAFSAGVAAQLRQEMTGVVEKGTARRAYHSVRSPDGAFFSIAGKTGTGDNRLRSNLGQGGEVRNRTAAFVFLIGDRYYGAITAYMPGSAAQAYRFTSALPVQLFRILVPTIVPADAGLKREIATVSRPRP